MKYEKKGISRITIAFYLATLYRLTLSLVEQHCTGHLRTKITIDREAWRRSPHLRRYSESPPTTEQNMRFYKNERQLISCETSRHATAICKLSVDVNQKKNSRRLQKWRKNFHAASVELTPIGEEDGLPSVRYCSSWKTWVITSLMFDWEENNKVS